MPETKNETTLSEEPSTSQTSDPKTFLFNPQPYAREKSTQTSKRLGKRSVKTLPVAALPVDTTETVCDARIDDIQGKSLAVEKHRVTAEQETEEATTKVEVKK